MSSIDFEKTREDLRVVKEFIIKKIGESKKHPQIEKINQSKSEIKATS